jgi:ribonuclease BN (tRNA processing enzyme)
MNSAPQFKLTFWGTRGSLSVNGADQLEFGGYTTCLGMQIGGRNFVFDSGTGVVGLGRSLVRDHVTNGEDGPLVTYAFHTHTHLDHVCGLQYFSPLYMANTTTYIFGPTTPFSTFEAAVRTLIHPPFHPVPLNEMAGTKVFGEVEEPMVFFFVRGRRDPVVVNMGHGEQRQNAPDPDTVEITLRSMRALSHPKCGVMVYRVEHGGRSVVFATDIEGYVHGDQRLIAFAKGADVLVHDAMYTEGKYAAMPFPTQGWGHSTVEIAIEVAKQAGVGSLYLVHHDPSHNDSELRALEVEARKDFQHTTLARDGMVVDVLNA